MFRIRRRLKASRKNYVLKNDEKVVQIPLTFQGRTARINSDRLNKGEYTLYEEAETTRISTPLIVL